MKTITLPSLPENIDSFIEIRDQIANSPEGGAAIFVLAMLMFENERKLGEQAFTVALDRNNLSESMMGYKGFTPSQSIKFHLNRFEGKNYWGKSYIIGTSFENGYLLPAQLNVEVGRNPSSEQSNGDIKVFVKCTGADTPRPITMRINDKGIWKAYECSSMFVDMRVPKQIISDDL
jgi:hypothetical protein